MPNPTKRLNHLLDRVETFFDRMESFFPTPSPLPNWEKIKACYWRKQGTGGVFQPVYHLHKICLQDLQGIATQKTLLVQNTQQFIQKYPANNALLWGARGTGKSSLIKALLNEYAAVGLRLIEVEKQDLMDLPFIVETLYARAERFIIFCDDLSFEHNDASYKALKSMLDGSISAPPDNVLIYATSNRRHLLPEYMRENLEAEQVEGEIHHGEAVEEKISLSERFGLWVSFYPFNQASYLEIVHYWLSTFGITEITTEIDTKALQWALHRGSRSGRSAWQFARDWAGRQAILR